MCLNIIIKDREFYRKDQKKLYYLKVSRTYATD